MQGLPIEVKVCIIGDTDVGKTSLSMRYCHGEFPENATPTIGASFLQKRISIEGMEVSLQIWDTAGQERFRSMAPMYYRGAKAAILVFDVTNEESFHRVTTWLRDLKAHADPDVVVCIAGNKSDIPPSFDLSICEDYANSVHAKFIRTSALTGAGVDTIFSELSQNILKVYKHRNKQSDKDQELLKLSETKKSATSTCC